VGTSKVLVGTVLAPQCKAVTRRTYMFDAVPVALPPADGLHRFLLVGTKEVIAL